MSFTVDHARKLLLHARNSGRMPHALLITGTREAGTHELVLALAKEFNGAVADQPENLRHPMCRILRPGSKSRRILIEDVRAVEPFLALRAEAHETKLVVILEADRMMDEPANAFLKTLEECHISATRRREMGTDIQGACGQLRRSRLNETGEHQ